MEFSESLQCLMNRFRDWLITSNLFKLAEACLGWCGQLPEEAESIRLIATVKFRSLIACAFTVTVISEVRWSHVLIAFGPHAPKASTGRTSNWIGIREAGGTPRCRYTLSSISDHLLHLFHTPILQQVPTSIITNFHSY